MEKGRALEIRSCTERDFRQVLPLLQQLWPGKELDAERLRVVYGKRLRSPTQQTLCVVEDGRLVGFSSMTLENDLWVEGTLAHIDELVVDKSRRGQGVGARLMEAMVSLARECGARRVELDTASHRLEAHAFYQHLGFENRGFVFSKVLS